MIVTTKTVYMLYYKPRSKFLDIDGAELEDNDLFNQPIDTYSTETPDEFLYYLVSIINGDDQFTDYEIRKVNIIINVDVGAFDINVSLKEK